MNNDDKPHGKGWTRQVDRWRITISLTPKMARRLAEEARAVGVAPAQLATIIVGRHYSEVGRG